MRFRSAAYAVCVGDGKVLLACHAPPGREPNGTLPGGGIVREVAGETGCEAVVKRLLGVDSRVVPAVERAVPGGGPEHQNVGVFHQVRVTGGRLRPEPGGEIAEPVRTPLPEVAGLRRPSPVDAGPALARTLPATGHVPPVAVGGLVRH
ncbi:NUDIX hydrolase [Streptomyces sp. MS19]|uniref:NUDIX hydrolase n=1 Tax=Streptomyces sp. MS19 TaxID=3385972 RepID=UPI0039A214E5